MSLQSAFRKMKKVLDKPNQYRHSISSRQTSIASSPRQVGSPTPPITTPGDAGKSWLDLRYHDSKKTLIKKPDELEGDMPKVSDPIDAEALARIRGSIVGMAIGDALGAHVEFQPRQYLIEKPVVDLQGGGTWGLRKGQFTDDTSMALCLANSLVSQKDFNLYNQLVRYKWWYRQGYMSSTGQCFDIGQATRESIEMFESRQKQFAKKHGLDMTSMDALTDPALLLKFDVYCSHTNVAGNGALMRLAPVPLFCHRSPPHAVEYSGRSGQVTHGDRKAYDACRYYGALITAALHGYKKPEILDREFYKKFRAWFGNQELCSEIRRIAEGSYQKPGGYDDGIRGGGYIVHALEAALWAFWSDDNSFQKGVLRAVNLGDDTDTTAAIYGQLAGACYGFKQLPQQWVQEIYAKKFLMNLSEWLAYEGEAWQPKEELPRMTLPSSVEQSNNTETDEKPTHASPTNADSMHYQVSVLESNPLENRRERHRQLYGMPSHGSMENSDVPLAGSLSQDSQTHYDPNASGQEQPDAVRNRPHLKKASSSTYSTSSEHDSLGMRRSRGNEQTQLAVHKTVSVPPSNYLPTSTIKNPSPKLSQSTYQCSRSIVAVNVTTTEKRSVQSSVASTEYVQANGLLNDRPTTNTNVTRKPPIDSQSQAKRSLVASMPFITKPSGSELSSLSRTAPYGQYSFVGARHHPPRNFSTSSSTSDGTSSRTNNLPSSKTTFHTSGSSSTTPKDDFL